MPLLLLGYLVVKVVEFLIYYLKEILRMILLVDYLFLGQQVL